MLGTRTGHCPTAVRCSPTPTTRRWCSSRSSISRPPQSPATRPWRASRAPPDPTSGSPPRPRPVWPPSSRRWPSTRRSPRPVLPPDTFLTVNVSPHILGSAPVQDALATRPGLQRVVVELTEHTPVHDLAALRRQCDELRARGALIALDDAGSGYSGLQQLAALRPQVVKLDRALVSDADTDPVRVALAEMLGEFAGRIDAWLLAEGIETPAELAAFALLGVPLAQGWLLGRPDRASRRSRPRRSGWSGPRSPAPGHRQRRRPLRPVRQARSARSSPASRRRPGRSTGRTGRTAARRPADGGGLHRPRLAAGAPL